jgi:ABC-type antimicrobial peptide transport system permease subunit
VWEFGVLRSMGVSKKSAMRMYMYEAFAVILSSLFLGTFVGFVVAATMTA